MLHKKAPISLDLDHDIEQLERLDSLRRKCDDLRRRGWESLQAELNADVNSNTDERATFWAVGKEPKDFVAPALRMLVATREFAFGKDGPDSRLIDRIIDELGPDSEEQCLMLLPGARKQTDDGEAELRVPIFQAARTFQALSSYARTAFSPLSMVAYYRVARELFSIEGENWIVGGARATEGGMPTAFITGECVRSIRALGRSMETTAGLMSAVIELDETATSLSTGTYIPRAWAEQELKRLALSTYTLFASEARRSVFNLGMKDLQILLDTQSRPIAKDRIAAFVDRFITVAVEDAERAYEGVTKALKTIEKSRGVNKTEDTRNAHLEAAAHLAGRDLLEIICTLAMKWRALVTEARKVFGKDSATCPNKRSHIADAKRMVSQLKSDSLQLVDRLRDAINYIESVLDREVEKSSTGHGNSGELAFAAATFIAIRRDSQDRRIERAAEILCNGLSYEGLFDIPGILDTDNHGYRLVLLGSEVLRSVSYLLEKVDVDIPHDAMQRIATYFLNRVSRGKIGDSDVVGWPHDDARRPTRVQRWTTCLSLLALDRFVRMLDERINRRVLRHFSHRTVRDLRGGPNLDQLVYPDYELAASRNENTSLPENLGESIACFAERMRAHTFGLNCHPQYGKECYSAVFYGPPGTGKTTIVEALARSAKTFLVEVTPSDFLVQGEAFLERRARHVFKALSMLTRATILFDEFDPVIRSREIDSNRTLDQYYFLTPGMLPKLKELNEKAKTSKSVFCLLTNRIGILDQAAIRSGRFDFKIGVFPPDLLSRFGAISRALNQLVRLGRIKPGEIAFESWCEAVAASSNIGMTILGKRNNLSMSTQDCAEFSKSKIKPGTIIAHIFGTNGGRLDFGPPDADPQEKREGRGAHFDLENRQWKWILERDKTFGLRLEGARRLSSAAGEQRWDADARKHCEKLILEIVSLYYDLAAGR